MHRRAQTLKAIPKIESHIRPSFHRSSSATTGVLHEIDKLTGELKRPVKCASRTVDVQANGQRQEALKASTINFLTLLVSIEEDAKCEGVGHFSIVHFHIWTNLARRLFWIKRGEAVDHVICFRAIGKYSLSIQKVAPLHDYLRHA